MEDERILSDGEMVCTFVLILHDIYIVEWDYYRRFSITDMVNALKSTHLPIPPSL